MERRPEFVLCAEVAASPVNRLPAVSDTHPSLGGDASLREGLCVLRSRA